VVIQTPGSVPFRCGYRERVNDAIEDESAAPEQGARPGALPVWKKALLGLAAASVLFGFGLRVFAGPSVSPTSEEAAPTPRSTGVTAPQSGSLLPGGTPGTVPETTGGGETTAAAPDEPGDWSPLFIKGGFSFFVGFCIGYALRAFFKISAVALGLVFLVIFGLEYTGLIEVDWQTASGWYDAALEKVSTEFESVKGFVTGSLPSAGLAVVGLYAGFKRTK
jgi:uncharacterized membrane protein (Fun14 family)